MSILRHAAWKSSPPNMSELSRGSTGALEWVHLATYMVEGTSSGRSLSRDARFRGHGAPVWEFLGTFTRLAKRFRSYAVRSLAWRLLHRRAMPDREAWAQFMESWKAVLLRARETRAATRNLRYVAVLRRELWRRVKPEDSNRSDRR